MKIPLAIVAFTISIMPTHAEIVFQGYMGTATRSLFVLSVDKKRTSGWLTIGQTFEDFSIVAFDNKTELLTVEKDGKRQALRLVDGRVQAASDVKAASNEKAKDRVSINFQDENVRDILKNVADLFEFPLVMPDELKGNTTLKLANVTWRQIFETSLKPIGYTYREENGSVWIVKKQGE